MWALIVPVKERLCRFEQSREGVKELTVGDFAAELPPPHLNGVQPRAIRRSVQQHQPPGRGTQHGFDFIIEMGIGVIPGPIDRASRMLVDQGL